MTLVQIKDWLKTLSAADYYYIGRIDNKQEKVLGIYDKGTSGRPVTALGGNSSYNIRSLSLLLHWNRNKAQAETAAWSLWNQLMQVHNQDVGKDQHIYFILFTVTEPMGVGTDENGVYEYVINFDLYYRR